MSQESLQNDIPKVIKRLTLIKNLISLEEEETIGVQIEKIEQLQFDEKILEILNYLKQKYYSVAVAEIEEYINEHQQESEVNLTNYPIAIPEISKNSLSSFFSNLKLWHWLTKLSKYIISIFIFVLMWTINNYFNNTTPKILQIPFLLILDFIIVVFALIIYKLITFFYWVIIEFITKSYYSEYDAEERDKIFFKIFFPFILPINIVSHTIFCPFTKFLDFIEEIDAPKSIRNFLKKYIKNKMAAEKLDTLNLFILILLAINTAIIFILFFVVKDILGLIVIIIVFVYYNLGIFIKIIQPKYKEYKQC
jgi:hypothetical protein